MPFFRKFSRKFHALFNATTASAVYVTAPTKTLDRFNSTKENKMKSFIVKSTAALPLLLCVPGLAAADPKCRTESLAGRYVFTATGFTRAPNSQPGTPWVPKAILEVLQFNGDGTLSTPGLTIANPVNDTGLVLSPAAGGAAGTYTINDDCSGSVQFLDAGSVAFKIQLDGPQGNTVWMIQTNPANNVFQGSAQRVR